MNELLQNNNGFSKEGENLLEGFVYEDAIIDYGVKNVNDNLKPIIEALSKLNIKFKSSLELGSGNGSIYGDSITLERAKQICERLKAKGFASTNVVLGIGSYTYQYNTRDTFGFAMKATYGEVNGEAREIWKDPITDDGTKKSAKGLLSVWKDDEGYFLQDQVSEEMENEGELEVVFEDGKLMKEFTLTEIRQNVSNNL